MTGVGPGTPPATLTRRQVKRQAYSAPFNTLEMETGEIIGYVATALGAGGFTQILNWRNNRKKGKEEGKGMEIENIKKVVDTVYTPLIDQLNKRVSNLTTENDQLRERLATQEKQIHGLQDQVYGLYKLLGKDVTKQVRNAKGQFAKMDEDNGEA